MSSSARMPAAELKSVHTTWVDEPSPEEANCTLRGCIVAGGVRIGDDCVIDGMSVLGGNCVGGGSVVYFAATALSQGSQCDQSS